MRVQRQRAAANVVHVDLRREQLEKLSESVTRHTSHVTRHTSHVTRHQLVLQQQLHLLRPHVAVARADANDVTCHAGVGCEM
jgi:hypothetical protein